MIMYKKSILKIFWRIWQVRLMSSLSKVKYVIITHYEINWIVNDVILFLTFYCELPTAAVDFIEHFPLYISFFNRKISANFYLSRFFLHIYIKLNLFCLDKINTFNKKLILFSNFYNIRPNYLYTIISDWY